jgi:hypothetical protein
LGTHEFKLTVDDGNGHQAEQMLTVTVADTTPPVIALRGPRTVSLRCRIDSYVEPGATAADDCDPGATVTIGGDAVDASTCGSYTVTYDAMDAAGNAAVQETRTVIVEELPTCAKKVLDLSAEAGESGIELRWTHVGAESYVVYREVEGGPRLLIAATASTESSWTDTDVVAGTVYDYRVTCVCDDGEGELSSVARAVVEVGPRFIRADCNEDGLVNISDPIMTLGVLFLGHGSFTCLEACDSNDDGDTNISDPITTLGFLFLGGYSIPAPGPEACGVDPGEDPLGCESFATCR